jgi:sporulation protein YlmC with PRC-barrel domain
MRYSAIALAGALAIATPAFAFAQTAPSFATLDASEMYASKVKGLNIYNQDNKSIGEIEDVAFSAKGVDAYIVSVGGFLGVGTKYVALAPSSVQVTWNASDKKWEAKMNATADQLKAAPEFKYPD